MKRQLILGLILAVCCFGGCAKESVNEESESFTMDAFVENWDMLKDAVKVERE